MSEQTGKGNQPAIGTDNGLHRNVAARRPTLPKRDLRFRQLLDLARGGDDIAVHSLWAEFQFDYAKEGGRDGLA